MTYDEFVDCKSYITCGDCANWGSKTCNRLWGIGLEFYHNYVVERVGNCICADFKPGRLSAWLYNNWQEEHLFRVKSGIKQKDTVALQHTRGNDDKHKLILFRKIDFYNGNLLREDGSLNFVKKMDYKSTKRTDENPTGILYVHEYPNGAVFYGKANDPIKWELFEK